MVISGEDGPVYLLSLFSGEDGPVYIYCPCSQDKLMALDREFEREEMRKINAEEQRQADEEAEKKRQERREEALQRRKAREEQQAKQREAEEENWEKAMSGELTGRRKAAIGASKSVSEVTLLGEQLLAEEKNDMYTAMFKSE